MEDPSRRRGRVLNICRGAEPGRLARLVLPAAYQRVVPIVRRCIDRAGGTGAGDRSDLSAGSQPFKSMPRRAAGA